MRVVLLKQRTAYEMRISDWSADVCPSDREGRGGQLGLVDDAQAARVRFCVDRRGVWLAVADGARGVHVNGREVRRLAKLRVGDAVYVDGVEMRVIGLTAPVWPGAALHGPTSTGTDDWRGGVRGGGGPSHDRRL